MFKKEIFIKRLNSLMQQHKTTKQALADAIHISRPAVSQFANGANLPSIEKLVALADYFQVSLDYLCGKNDNPRHSENKEKTIFELRKNMPDHLLRSFNYALNDLPEVNVIRDFKNLTESEKTSNLSIIVNLLKDQAKKSLNLFVNDSEETLPVLDVFSDTGDSFSTFLKCLLGYNNPTVPKEMKLFLEPDGELYYDFEYPLHGALKYSFGIFPNGKSTKVFLYLEEQSSQKLIDSILANKKTEFLSLVSLLNWKLHFKYNPYEENSMDIIIPRESPDGNKYQGIKLATPLYSIDLNYCNFIEEYLKKTTGEKNSLLTDYVLENYLALTESIALKKQ